MKMYDTPQPVERYLNVELECDCGRTHYAPIKAINISSGALESLPGYVAEYGYAKPYILCDKITWEIAGKRCEELLKDAGFLVKDINMKAYMEVRSLTQEFIDDFLGYWIDPKNALMTSLLVGCGLPGGMMGSLMADLKGMHMAINANLKKKGEPELSEDELLVQLFDEVQRIWPMLGTPCLVTPFSQYVKNAALMNLFSRSMGEKDFTRMDPAMWGMILGKSGKLPGELAPEIIELAKEKGFEFYTDDPQKLYPNVLPQYIKEMEELGWDRGQDDEELFEFAMHDKQYREYKSGQAKEQFNKDLAERMQKAGKEVPENLRQYLPNVQSANVQCAKTGNDDQAAVAYALYLAGKKPKEGIITLPEIHHTAWNHKYYTLK